MRNYRKESDWDKSTYTRFQAKLKKDEAETLRAVLKKCGMKFTDWVRSKIRQGADNE